MSGRFATPIAVGRCYKGNSFFTRQKMRRFPRAAIEELAESGGGVAQAELTECTARWLAAHAAGPGWQGP
jgi:hypothetical protein